MWRRSHSPDPSEHGNPEVQLDLFDPMLDPSEGGPLGLLWPLGWPSWYREVHELTPPAVATLAQFRAEAELRRMAHIVAHGSTYDVVFHEAENLIYDGLEFTRFVMGSRTPPPVPCLYVPDGFPYSERNRVLGALVDAGATVFGERELDMP